MAGAGAIAAAGANGLQITQQGARGIIDWRSFNIGAGGSVAINNGSGVTLNRVTGGQMSTIEGSLSATGSLYLVNPQGVVIGPGGQVLSGGSVVISTRNIANDAFMAGGSMTASGLSAGDVTNKGTVLARQGDVVIIGQNVTNTGSISAANGMATLAAGNAVVLAPVGGTSGVVVAADAGATGDVTQAGQVQAAAAALTAAGGNVYSLAGATGLTQATGTSTVDGHVYLTAPNGMVSVAGAVTARNADGSGGVIIANGKTVNIGATARIDATGLHGGRVLIGVSAPQTDLADTTTIADGATILAGGPGGGGSIETSGHTIKIGMATVSPGKGGSWLLDPTDLTIDTALATTIDNSLNAGGITVTESATNDLTVSAPISWTTNSTLVLTSGNNMTIGASITGMNGALSLTNATNLVVGTAEMNIYNPISVGTLNINSGNTLNVYTSIAVGGALTSVSNSGTNLGALGAPATITANSVSMNALYWQFVISAGSTISGTTGVSIGTGQAFLNSGGASAVTVGGGANYLIYSKDPSLDTTGGLTNNFIQYSASFGATPLGAGNGFLYSLAPVLNYALNKGSTTKVYDGTTAVNQTTPLTAANNLTYSGLQSGDTIAILNPLSAVYTSANVGTSLTVTIPGVSITHTGGIPVYGYAVGQQNLSGVIGAITPAALSITSGVAANNKTYDGTTTGTLTVGTVGLTGVVAADAGNSARLAVDSSGATSTFAGANVANGVSVTAAGFTLTGSSKTNYTLTQPTGLSANIGKATLTAVGISAADKNYDGATGATLSYANANLSGLAAADVGNVTLNTGGVTAAFSTANVGNGLTVTISGLAVAGSQAGNYTMTPTAIAHASIAPVGVTITGLSVAPKTYDGTTAATVNTGGAALSGVVAADTGNAALLALNSSGITAQFTTANAGNGVAVTITGFTLNGTKASNYTLTQPTGLTANITPVTLTAGLNDSYSKVYDGTVAATITDLTKFSLSGFIGADSATISQVLSANYNSANAGTGKTVVANLVASDYSPAGGTVLSNYVLPTTVTNAGTAQITPAPLVITIVGNPSRSFTTAGDTSAVLSANNFLIQGFATGQSATINQTVGTYASGAAGTEGVSAVVSAGNFANAAGGFTLSNYSFTSPVSGFGTIVPIGGFATTFTPQVKIYDGIATISLSTGAFTVTGPFNPGDGATVVVANTGAAGILTSQPMATTNVGIQPLVFSLTNSGGVTGFGNYIGTGATNLTSYSLPTFAAGQITINAKALTAAIISTSLVKTYDGGTLIALKPTDYSLAGFVGSDGATVTQTVGNFASANVAGTNGSALSATLQAPNLSAFLTPNPGTLLSNYILPTTASGLGTINKASLTVTSVYGVNKVYDSTTTAALNISGASLSGVVGSDAVTLTAPSTGVFASANVGSGVAISTAAFTIGGASAGNYTLVQPTGLNANITAAPLTTNVFANNKTYDGNTTATLGGLTLNGVYASDSANVALNSGAVTPAFTQSDAANGISVTAAGFTLTGSAATNYKLIAPAHLTANIIPKQLSGAIINNPTKIYDGTAALTLGSSNFSISGWVGADGATIIPTAANNSFVSANVLGSTLSTATSTLAFSNFVASGSTKLSNYYLPGGPSQVTGQVTGAATITPAPLVAQIVGNPTRAYDGSTDTNNVNGASGLLSANYALLGFIGADGATVANNLTGVFNTRHVGTDTITVSLAPSNFTGTGATLLTNYALPTTATGGGTITPFALTISGVLGTNKVYENSTYDSLNTGGAVLNGVFAIDSGLGITYNGGNGAFSDKNVGNGKTVTASGFTLNNNTNGDYVLTQPIVTTANITPAPLTLQVSKVYDGGTDASATVPGIVYSNLNGIYNGDIVSLGSTTSIVGSYASPHVDTANNTVTFTTGPTLNGADSGNYRVVSGLGTITPANLTVTGVSANNKTYDGNTTATLNNAGAQLSGLFAVDNGVVTLTTPLPTTGTFAQSNVGNAIAVTTTYAVSGNSHGDYTFVQPGLSANIVPAGLTLINVASVQKVYDGTTGLPGTINLANFFTLSGVVGGDQVSVASAAGAYASANVGTGIGVTITNGSVVLTGAQAGNYSVNNLTPGSLIGVITPAPLNVTLAAITKVYDRTTGATLTPASFGISGLVHGETATINQTTGTYTNANVQGAGGSTVNASLTAGNFVGANGFLASNYSFSSTVTNTVSTITPAPLTVTGLVANNKVYDTTTAATIATALEALQGVIAGDTVTVSATANAGTFANKNVGNGKAVSATLSDFLLGGAQAGNYTITGTNALTANITPAPVTLAGVIANNKVYDSTVADTLTLTGATLNGKLGADSLGFSTLGGTGVFGDKNVANGKTVTATLGSITLTGTDAGNYALTGTNALTANITPAPVTLAGVVANNKVYDSTTADTLTLTGATLNGKLGADSLSFSTLGGTGVFGDKNVANGKTVTATLGSITLTGTDAGNYTITGTNALTANITPVPLTVAGVIANNKTYDGNTTATLNNAGDTLSGKFAGDTVTLVTAGATGTFSDANVGNGKTVTLAGFTVSGADTGNYTFTQPASVTANITSAGLTLINVASVQKVYDGTTGLPGTINLANFFTLSGVVGGDQVSVASAAGAYASANVGTGIGVTITNGSVVLTGAQAGNYSVNNLTPGSLIGIITPAPLNVTLAAITKVYDRTTGATLTPASFGISGLVHGETATINQTAGTYTNANVLGAGASTVNASLAAGNFVGANGFLASNYSFSSTVTNTVSTITPAPLTVTGLTANNKVYDATTAATIATALEALQGVIAGDTVTVSATANAGTFANKNVGNGKAVSATLSDFLLGGAQAGNYTITGTNALTANITPAPVTLAGVIANNKVYDSTVADTLTLTGATLNGKLGADSLGFSTLGGTGVFSDKNVANGKTVTATLGSITLTGTDAGNYALTGTNALTANITPAPLTVAGVIANNKVYDTTTVATLNNTNDTLSGLFAGDAVTLSTIGATGAFATKDVGNAKTVTAAGYTISGADLGNYTFTQPVGLSANITPAPLSISGLVANNKPYDGNTVATLDTSHPGTLTGVLGADVVTLGSLPTGGVFASPNAANGIAVSFVGGSISGADAHNYTLSGSGSLSANITPLTLTAAITGTPTKTYDATTGATLSPSDYTLTGFILGQGAAVTQTTGTYASPNAGPEAVTASLSPGNFSPVNGALLSNYVLPTSASGTGLINPAQLAATIIGTPTKTYDGTTPATLTPANFALTGFVPGEGAGVTQTVGTYASPNAGPEGVTAALPGSVFSPSGATLLSNYILPTSAAGAGLINKAPLTIAIIGTPTKPFDGNTGATLTPANFALTGFVGGEGGTVIQTVGTYAAPTPGSEPVTAVINGAVVTLNPGTLLANYALPTTASGIGLINPRTARTPTNVLDALLNALSLLPPQVAAAIEAEINSPGFVFRARQASFAIANVRTYIPYPAPGALSTWRNNGWGSLPIVVDETTDYAQSQDDNGNLAIQSGPPVINSTEQVLMSGVKNKRWRITIPQFANGPSLFETGATVAGQ